MPQIEQQLTDYQPNTIEITHIGTSGVDAGEDLLIPFDQQKALDGLTLPIEKIVDDELDDIEEGQTYRVPHLILVKPQEVVAALARAGHMKRIGFWWGVTDKLQQRQDPEERLLKLRASAGRIVNTQ